MRKLFVLLMGVMLWSCTQNMQELELQNVQFLKGSGVLYCMDSKSSVMELSWDYPVKPGMEEWAQFKNTMEMTDACQIPEYILSTISTKELAAICLQYPMLHLMFGTQTDDNIDAMFDGFNGIRELFKRDETAKELLSWYNSQILHISLLDKKDLTDLEKGSFIYSIQVLEYLLSRAAGNYNEILKNLVTAYEKQLKYTNYMSLDTNFFPRAHIINKMCPQCFDDVKEKSYLFSQFYMENTKDIINKLSYQLIK